MHRYGGTAGGGSSKKEVIEVKRPVPKFLQSFKYQNPEETLEQFANQVAEEPEAEKKEDDYDVENALVLDENGQPIEEKSDEKSNKNKNRQIDYGGYAPSKNPEDYKKVDIQTFHPTFKTKKGVLAAKEDEDKEDVKKNEKPKEKEKEKSKDKEGGKDEKKSDSKSGKGNTEVETGKRSLDTYVKGFLKDDKSEQKVNKKVKSTLLSFGDDD